MLRRSSYEPSRDLLTETIRAGVSLDAKVALTRAARQAGMPVSGFIREAVEAAVARQSRPRAKSPRS